MYYPKIDGEESAPLEAAPPPATGFPMNTMQISGNWTTTPPGTGFPTNTMQISGNWTTGLCGCCEDCNSCCLAFWCPCIAFGRIAHTVDRGLTSCCGAGSLCCVLGLFVGFHWIYTCIYRRNLRMLYNLPETPCCDCCVEYCCECCSLSQMYRELQNRGFDMSLNYNQNLERMGRAGMQPPTVQGAMMR